MKGQPPNSHMPLGQTEQEPESSGAGDFHTTHWSVVTLAGQTASPQAAAALEELCRTYWSPLYFYIRRRGHGPEEARDLTQEFFLRLLKRNDFARADRQKGRFRSFLLGAMNHFLAYEWRKEQAARRGGGQRPLPLDDPRAEDGYRNEPVSDTTPEKLFERRWALTLFDRALTRLQEEWDADRKSRQFNRLKQFLSSQPADGEYVAVGAELQMSSGAVGAAVHRMRRRYRNLVREEIARTVDGPDELEAELRHLLTVLGP
jgi:DNA-directed RNA polymerase specialized sigma24 family protein